MVFFRLAVFWNLLFLEIWFFLKFDIFWDLWFFEICCLFICCCFWNVLFSKMWYFWNLLLFKSVVFSNLLLLWSTPICCQQVVDAYFLQNLKSRHIYKVVVAFFKNILKVVFLLLQGGPPPAPPRRSKGGRPIGQEISQIFRGIMKKKPAKCRSKMVCVKGAKLVVASSRENLSSSLANLCLAWKS